MCFALYVEDDKLMGVVRKIRVMDTVKKKEWCWSGAYSPLLCLWLVSSSSCC